MTEKFSASNAAKHMACPASANLDKAIYGWTPPDKDSTVASQEGTDAHELLAKAAAMTPRNLEHLITALQYLHDLTQGRRFNKLIEHKIVAEWLDSKPETTVDLVLYTQTEIHALDWKWGKILVEADGNKQLLFYAASFAHLAPKAKGIWIHVVQPKADNLEAIWVSSQELAAFMRDARRADKKIAAGDLTFGPSDACTFCPAYPHGRGVKGKPFCPATMQLLYPSYVDEDEVLGL